MRCNILLFCGGLALLNFLPSLPDKPWITYSACLAVIAILIIFSLRLRRLIPLCFLCAGLAWGLMNGQFRLEQRIDAELEGVPLRVSGVVSNLPKQGEMSSSFLFDTSCIERIPSDLKEGVEEKADCIKGPKRLRLSWYGFSRKELRAGQAWQLDVKLKRPKGFANPGGFDYEKWLFAQNIGATGYVLNKGEHHRLGASKNLDSGVLVAGMGKVNALRQSIAENIDASGHSSVALAFLKALTIGDKRDITPVQHASLAATGTSHLLAVSGLHIGLVFGFIYLISHTAFRYLTTLNQYASAQKVAITLSLAVATFYCALAGFSLPTLRAWIMISCFAWGVLKESPQSSWDSYVISLFLVCLVQPFAVLEMGFWLSYIAVAVILFVVTGRVRKRASAEQAAVTPLVSTLHKYLWAVREVWRSQLGIFIGLLPLVIIFYGQLPLLSPLINLFAVPFVGWFVVPPALLGVLVSPWASAESNFFFSVASQAVDWFWFALDVISNLSWISLTLPSIDATLSKLCLVVLCVLLLLPKSLHFRWLSVFLILPPGLELFADSGEAKPFFGAVISGGPVDEGRLNFTVLDVGQGLSAVFETANHVLVYDTGPALGTNLDAGKAVISPFLKSQGRHRIDMLVVSHDDIDHAGGAKTMVEQHPINTFIAWPDTMRRVGEPILSSVNETDECREYRAWQWDGVNFALFSWMSFGGSAKRDNNYSCILKVWGQGFSILVPGDIEKRTEYSLLSRIANYQKYQCLGFDLRADILIAPHHGSKSSSSSMFIRAVQPDQVIFSSAYRSRFGHPHADIVKRYQDNEALYWNTASSGALSYEFSSEQKGRNQGHRLMPERYRVSNRRFWHLSEKAGKVL